MVITYTGTLSSADTVSGTFAPVTAASSPYSVTPDAAQKYYRIPVRTDLDRSQLPAWMNEPFTPLPLDWELLRKNGNDWLRYWDTEIRGKNR